MDKGFEAYKIYISIRAHFHGGTRKGYDINTDVKTAKVDYDSYKSKSATVAMFNQLTEKFNQDEIEDIIVSNFATGDRWGGQPFDSNAMDVYKDWLSRRNKRSYQFKEDLDSLSLRQDKEHIEDVTVATGHPLIIKMLLGSQIALETVVILNRELNFINEYSEDLILQDTCQTVLKYTAFVEDNTKRLYIKHLDLINKIASTRNSANTLLI